MRSIKGLGLHALRACLPPPPPPRGAAIIIDRWSDRTYHVDVHCAEADTTRACADIATQFLDKLNGEVQAK